MDSFYVRCIQCYCNTRQLQNVSRIRTHVDGIGDARAIVLRQSVRKNNDPIVEGLDFNTARIKRRRDDTIYDLR